MKWLDGEPILRPVGMHTVLNPTHLWDTPIHTHNQSLTPAHFSTPPCTCPLCSPIKGLTHSQSVTAAHFSTLSFRSLWASTTKQFIFNPWLNLESVHGPKEFNVHGLGEQNHPFKQFGGNVCLEMFSYHANPAMLSPPCSATMLIQPCSPHQFPQLLCCSLEVLFAVWCNLLLHWWALIFDPNGRISEYIWI